MIGDIHNGGGEERQSHESGVSVLELATLPPALVKIVRLVLRHSEITYPALCDAIVSLPDGDALSQAELDLALDTLCAQGWIRRCGAHFPAYRVNLGRKANNVRTQDHPGHKSAGDMRRRIWAALDADTAGSGAEPADSAQQAE